MFRSYSSLPAAIVDAEGRPINAVYGLLAAIGRLIREENPDSVMAAFDEPDVPTFRHLRYPQYQGHRGPLGGDNAEDFARQVGIARDVLPRLGGAAVSAPGYEADDVMGSAAVRLAAEGHSVTLVSTDRDLLQLVGRGIEIVVPGKVPLRISDAEGARQRIGVAPQHVTTYKALAGDASDHIPGVPGIGHKTAVDLIERYGDLETIYQHRDDLSPRARRNLETHIDTARLFREIATIDTSLEVGSLIPLSMSADEGPRPLLERAGHPLKAKEPADASAGSS